MKETHQRPVCHRAEDLVGYLYGEASPTDALDFRNHLQQCDACRSEFASFNQLHNSIKVWRDEALGASFNPMAVAVPASDATQFVRHERKLSAFAALREFFTVSPLWLRGATAFATLLLCVLAVMMVARVSRKPAVVATIDDQQRRYSEQDLQNEVNKAVEQKVRELRANNQNPSPAATDVKPKSAVQHPNPLQLASDRQPKNGHPRALNRQEREQLAADLRVVLPADEEDPFLAFPDQEHPNQ
jgi:anti-sigma factor RsiW